MKGGIGFFYAKCGEIREKVLVLQVLSKSRSIFFLKRYIGFFLQSVVKCMKIRVLQVSCNNRSFCEKNHWF